MPLGKIKLKLLRHFHARKNAILLFSVLGGVSNDAQWAKLKTTSRQILLGEKKVTEVLSLGTKHILLVCTNIWTAGQTYRHWIAQISFLRSVPPKQVGERSFHSQKCTAWWEISAHDMSDHLSDDGVRQTAAVTAKWQCRIFWLFGRSKILAPGLLSGSLDCQGNGHRMAP